jgi:hypothetical protein
MVKQILLNNNKKYYRNFSPKIFTTKRGLSSLPAVLALTKGSVYVPHVSMHPQKKRNHQAPAQACTAPATNQRILVRPRSTLLPARFTASLSVREPPSLFVSRNTLFSSRLLSYTSTNNCFFFPFSNFCT